MIPTPEPSLSIYHVAGFFCSLITFFGWYIAVKIRRPMVFRLKLAIVYVIPFCMSLTYLIDEYRIDHEYRMLLLMTFIMMLQMLYWREIRSMTTSIGYHKDVLVNFLDILPDMVWMKDLDGKFTYTNKSIREGLLCCSEEEAFGHTGEELAVVQRNRGYKYTFGEVCSDSDTIVKSKGQAERFLEFGDVNGKFLALQVFKSPLYSKNIDGTCSMIGTIGMGRDLTYDYLDHAEIKKMCDEGDIEEALKAFEVHANRYVFNGIRKTGKGKEIIYCSQCPVKNCDECPNK